MKERIEEFLAEKNYSGVRGLLLEMQTVDIAELLEELEPKQCLMTFRLLEKDQAADVFANMESEYQERLVRVLTDQELENVAAGLFVDDAADLIGELPANLVKRILKVTPPSRRKQINDLLQYPDESAGSIMTVEFVDLQKDMTVQEAFRRIRAVGTKKETIYTCYVLDSRRRLQGTISAKELLLAQERETVSDLMEENVVFCHTMADQEEAANLLSKYDLLALPVVDSENRMVGIITVDDAMDIIQEENDEDFAIMAAMTPGEDSYFQTSVWQHSRRRIVWLLLLMLSAAITGTIITKYEDAFSAVPLLVAFIPMLMDTGGNCGSQSSTLIIRGLATDEMSAKDLFSVLWKEVRIATVVGAVLALVNGARIFFQYDSLPMAMVVGLTLMGTVMLSKILGCLLPMAAKALKLDPAIMAAPLITTLVDAFSVLIYFQTAVWIMKL